MPVDPLSVVIILGTCSIVFGVFRGLFSRETEPIVGSAVSEADTRLHQRWWVKLAYVILPPLFVLAMVIREEMHEISSLARPLFLSCSLVLHARVTTKIARLPLRSMTRETSLCCLLCFAWYYLVPQYAFNYCVTGKWGTIREIEIK